MKGSVEILHSQLDDFILLRTDGTPTYNFVVVVDDMRMGVTHVVRGDDHLNNTPKQILLYQAMDATPPIFAHLPLILGQDGSRLSKRHGATSVDAYRKMGLLREAMVNYLARLGWSHGDQEEFSSAELVEFFDLPQVSKAGARWDMDKLLWLNQVWMKRLDLAEVCERARPFFEARGLMVDERLPEVVSALRERSRTLVELAENGACFFQDEVEIEEKAARKFLKASTGPLLRDLIAELQATETWDRVHLEETVQTFVESRELKLGKVAQPVRVSVTGKRVGPGLYELMVAAGRERSLSRIENGAALCEERAAAIQ